jgi:hypothetical protein
MVIDEQSTHTLDLRDHNERMGTSTQTRNEYFLYIFKFRKLQWLSVN